VHPHGGKSLTSIEAFSSFSSFLKQSLQGGRVRGVGVVIMLANGALQFWEAT